MPKNECKMQNAKCKIEGMNTVGASTARPQNIHALRDAIRDDVAITSNSLCELITYQTECGLDKTTPYKLPFAFIWRTTNGRRPYIT